ncbi:hypothetical protein T484DRAFT_1910289 [Baffinella frigidus]|nr:hypothetical protein T484DRAFT_1910289 [Cryptophyta sp. CCMP2293]
MRSAAGIPGDASPPGAAGDHEMLATRGEHSWFSVAAARAARRRSSAADRGTCALLRGAAAAAKEQAALGFALVRSRSLGSVMLVVWLATLGGSIQAPALSFFYQLLGMSPGEIGVFGLIVNVGVLISSPLYGHLLDKVSPFLAVSLSLLTCALGCLIRGLAASKGMVWASAVVLGMGAYSFEQMALATVARRVPCALRSLVVSGFLLQIKAVSFAATLLYPSWVRVVEGGLQVDDTMTRYRITMGMCSVPCLLGWCYLV